MILSISKRKQFDPSAKTDVTICCYHMRPYNLLYLKYVFQSVQMLLVIP